MTLELLPAVDVTGGRAVQLVRGQSGRARVVGTPLDAALDWQREGARWVHLVDVDAAFGRGSNAELLTEVVGVLDVDVELSGGIRDEESLQRALATGCRRVNIATSALEHPQWCAEAITRYGDRLAVGFDVRGTRLSARGGPSEGDEFWETLSQLDRDGCPRYVVTDVTKDGRLQGPNLDLLRQFCTATTAPVVASGGISTLEDLLAIAGIHGIEGAIIGTALYEGAFSLPDALARMADVPLSAPSPRA